MDVMDNAAPSVGQVFHPKPLANKIRATQVNNNRKGEEDEIYPGGL